MTNHETAAGRSLGLAVAALALFLAATASAAEGPPPPAAAPLTSDSFRDVQLTIQARRVLAADPALAPLNLGVRVRRGIATLWGPVPSADLLRQAVRKLEQVRGIFQVRPQETFLAPTPPRVSLSLPLHREPPTRTQSASPDPVSGSLGTLTGRAVPSALPPSEQPPPKAPPVSVPSPPADVSAAVERLRLGDRRFRPVHVEVRGGTVLLRAGDAGPEAVMAFAQELSHLPGVERVVIGSASGASGR